MKKIILTAIFMVATSGFLFAQTNKPVNGAQGTNKNNPGYVDANKNGICDTYENNTPGTNKSNPGYVDANKNGVCDTYENTAGNCVGKGQGRTRGQVQKCRSGMANGQGRATMQGQNPGNGRRGK